VRSHKPSGGGQILAEVVCWCRRIHVDTTAITASMTPSRYPRNRHFSAADWSQAMHSGTIVRALFCALTTTSLFAVGIPHLDIPVLVNAADVIVVAEVSERARFGEPEPLSVGGRMVQAVQYSTRLHVIRTIKGHCAREIVVTYTLPTEFEGYSPLQTGTRMVF